MEKIDTVRWLVRFAQHLRELDPSLNGTMAARAASDAFPESWRLEPEEAADTYAARSFSPGANSVRSHWPWTRT
jgi:hypothetical protein